MQDFAVDTQGPVVALPEFGAVAPRVAVVAVRQVPEQRPALAQAPAPEPDLGRDTTRYNRWIATKPVLDCQPLLSRSYRFHVHRASLQTLLGSYI